jgi:hypothetical protein
MSKNPNNKNIISKIVSISQAIEGYTPSNTSVIEKAQLLRKKYGIKVSVSK